MFTEKHFKEVEKVKDLFKGYGSFGEIAGEIEKDGNTIYHKTDSYEVACKYEKDAYGVFSRKDTFTNKSDKAVELRSFKSCFVFEYGEMEVYTQFNNWQTESIGAWQPLASTIAVRGESVRTTTDATPFLVLWNEQTHRGIAFHLLPNSAWEMKVSRVRKTSKHSKILVELGVLDYNFAMNLEPGASYEAPEIICYEIRNKLHMDCYKLHNYMHTKYPRREMPIIYDTWMYKFDHITYENVAQQVELAANLGVEYFFIDAGWFGKGANWGASVGDWEENTVSHLCGRMIDIANKVRENGMKFGLWIEPERATTESDSFKNYPQYYMTTDGGSVFLDFANAEAREWMLGIIDNLIERYGIEYIKDDFNADMYFDPYGTAFVEYHKGHDIFIDEIRRRHPNLYLSSCAAGGHRLELKNYTQFDSSWPSDNESPYVEMRIYRDTILRLPPQAMERWVAAHSLIGLEDFYEPFQANNGGTCERMVACADAVWHNIVGVQPSFMNGYMTCGPIGFSCDLSKFSEQATADFKAHVQKVKENRDFWIKAVARILSDTPSLTTYQYSDMALSRVVIQLFTHKLVQNTYTVIPELDPAKNYRVDGGEVQSGQKIMDEGIIIKSGDWVDKWHDMFEVEIIEA